MISQNLSSLATQAVHGVSDRPAGVVPNGEGTDWNQVSSLVQPKRTYNSLTTIRFMKHSDRPIYRPKEDLLGRAKFSLFLARAIDNLSIAKDGFVIAVTGEWGSGKSSVVEMTARYLIHLELERAGKPGEEETLGSLETLAEAYDLLKDRLAEFNRLELNFRMAQSEYRRELFERWLGNESQAIQADRYWTLLKRIEDAPRTIQIRFSPWLIAGHAELASAFLSEIARTLGEKLGSEVRDAFALLLQRLSEFAPIAGAGLDLATGGSTGKLLASGASLSGKIAARLTAGPTLDELRDRLRSALKKLPSRRILVIVDDLDRLTPSEAVEMVSLVKSLGDLPNVIYLLSFDQTNLERLLSEGTKLNGAEFLSKIIQYPVNVPPILGRGLARLLDADLTEIIGELDSSDAQRLGRTWYFAFRYYLKTPRDVRLYGNSVAVALASQRDFVDPIDLLLLELLRLHEPRIYNWVRENLDELTS
ncbi:P-loop NTPase fold protein [Bradyrhizobium guangdongense]